MATRLQRSQLCKGFLRLHGKGQELDAMEAARLMNDTWGIKEDWHEFAYALDDLCRAGEATRTKIGGFERYIVT